MTKEGLIVIPLIPGGLKSAGVNFLTITAMKIANASSQMLVTEFYLFIAKKKVTNSFIFLYNAGVFPNPYSITFSEDRATCLISSPLTSSEDVNEVLLDTRNIATTFAKSSRR